MITPDEFRDTSYFNVWIWKEVYRHDGPHWTPLKRILMFKAFTPITRPRAGGRSDFGRLYHKVRWHHIVALKLAGIPHEIDAQFP